MDHVRLPGRPVCPLAMVLLGPGVSLVDHSLFVHTHMEGVVRKHVTTLLQYTASTQYRFPCKEFLTLVAPHMPAHMPTEHPLVRLMVAPFDHFPNEQDDQWVFIARDESYRLAERYLATELFEIPLAGTGLRPHENSLEALTACTVDTAIDQGLFTTAIVVLDTLQHIRTPALRHALTHQLTVRKTDWKPAVIDGRVAVFNIITLNNLRTLPMETSTILLDLAHLWGSRDHYDWVKYIKEHCVAKDRTMRVMAMGWQNVPAITPGWCLNERIFHSAVDDMLNHGPWGTNGTLIPRHRTYAALLKMPAQLAQRREGLVVMGRGMTTIGMEAGLCQRLKSALGHY